MTISDPKPVTMYPSKIIAEPELVTEDRIAHVDIELTKPQTEELIEILKEKLTGTVGAVRIRFSGTVIH